MKPWRELFTEPYLGLLNFEDVDEGRTVKSAVDYDTALFGVHFKSLYLGPETDDRKVEALHRSVYADYFSPEHMQRFIQLPLRHGETVHPAPEWVEEDEEEVFP